MAAPALPTLLGPGDPAPFRVIEGRAGSEFLLTADHAGRIIPRALADLGLGASDLERHIAWDIGIGGVSERLAPQLGAFMIAQTYSRLVIDCNRPLESPSSIASESEHTRILANEGLSEAERQARATEIFLPYHQRIEAELERRERAGEAVVLITMHSFTPCYKGVERPWLCGVLYNRDPRLALALLTLLRADGLVVGDNQPYFVSDDSDYGIPRYGEQRGHLHVELEIRQDLITLPEQQAEWAERLGRLLPVAVQRVRRAQHQG